MEDDTLDCPEADLTEPRNPLLQPIRSQEGVDVEQILHPLQSSAVDLPAASARARVGLALGWPGQATRSIPVARFLGRLPPHLESPHGDIESP